MSSDSQAVKAARAPQSRRARTATQPLAQTRERASESLHDDDNKRLAQDNDSELIADDLHGIDMTEATEWRRWSKLDAPAERPGYKQRWVRVRMAGKNDASNVMKRHGEGWRPRRISTIADGHLLPTIQLGSFGECIGVEDSILMEMPAKVFGQMQDYYRGKKRNQTASTENALQTLGDQHQVPIHRRKNRVTTLGGAPRVAADD